MITRVAAVAGWLAAGHAVLGSLAWLFLQIPESNAWMLASSLFVLLATVWLAGVVEMTAILALAVDGPLAGMPGPALRRAWLIVLPIALFAASWWVTGEAAAWHARHGGQLDAALIARTGWTRTTRLHAAVNGVITLIRWPVGVALAAALAAALARDGWRGVHPRWARRGLQWRPLAATAIALAAGVWLPWRAAQWRPLFLPPNWMEPAFAAIKLTGLFGVAQVAWAVILRAAARQR